MNLLQERMPSPGALDVERRLGAYFARREVRGRAWAYLRGLLSRVERKNGWPLAAVSGDTTPYGMQHL